MLWRMYLPLTHQVRSLSGLKVTNNLFTKGKQQNDFYRVYVQVLPVANILNRLLVCFTWKLSSKMFPYFMYKLLVKTEYFKIENCRFENIKYWKPDSLTITFTEECYDGTLHNMKLPVHYAMHRLLKTVAVRNHRTQPRSGAITCDCYRKL